MAKRWKKRKTEVRILSDHKKVGKTLVPPMRDYLGEQGTVSWEDRILPELIWLAVIIERLGVKRGVEVGVRIAKLANGILSDEYFAFVSSFDLLSTAQKQNLLQLLKDENYFDELSKSLSPLLQLYPECPLKFLDSQQEGSIQTQTISDFKRTLSKYYNRRAQPAMIIQSNVVYFAAICGKLHYLSDVQVPNIEAIISDFESEESKHACASVRATVNGFFGHVSEKISDHWPRYFWNRGIQIEPVTPITKESSKLDLELPDQIIRFIELADLGLDERWNKLPKDIYENYQCEVIGALLARQVTLAKRMVRNPAFWDIHIAPILLRVMIDNHITLAWILKDIAGRSKQFVLHGLGQAKLFVEHLKVENEDGSHPDVQQLIEAWEKWINVQQYSFLTNVNLGSWSGMDTRKMAEEADCLDLYRYAYTPFSSGVHNMWDHVGRLNVAQSGNPLHKYMLIPFDPENEPEFDLFLNCAKYLQESFSIVDETFNLHCNTTLPYDYWCNLADEKLSEPTRENLKSSGSSSDES
ncbi:DUF5677 domain-containing protein [Chloroflexota bacterium]